MSDIEDPSDTEFEQAPVATENWNDEFFFLGPSSVTVDRPRKKKSVYDYLIMAHDYQILHTNITPL